MSAQAWDLLVRRLEARAKGNPKSYRLRVGALAALGYLYLGTILVAVLGGAVWSLYAVATGHPLAIKLLIVLGVLAFTILRALPVKLDPPEGIPITADDAPELFTLIEELREHLATPTIHRVLVDGGFNASVSQTPRFGWFGPTRNYLVLGLPLITALSEAEFTAVLAHELGHVSGSHGRFSAWIYRVRHTWFEVLRRLETGQHWGAWLFRRFFRWYAPYFSAYSFVLAREQEYEADRAAMAAVGPDAAASALARVDLVARYLEESFWPEVYKATEHSTQPQARPLDRFAAWLASGSVPAQLAPLSAPALKRLTDTDDTHPSLSARLEALGVEAAKAAVGAAHRDAPPAAARFLGSAYRSLVERLDQEWQESVGDLWRAQHEESREARQRLGELQGRSNLDTDELLELAFLTNRFSGQADAMPVYRSVLERDPANASANYVVGQALLAAGDNAGLRHLDRAMASEPESILAAAQLAETFLVSEGRAGEAQKYRARRYERMDALERAAGERQAFTTRDKVVAHDRSPDEVEAIASQLRGYDTIKRAYLVKKAVEHLGDEFPVYLVALELRGQHFRLRSQDPVARVAGELEAPFAFFVIDISSTSRFRRRVRKAAGGPFYSRS